MKNIFRHFFSLLRSFCHPNFCCIFESSVMPYRFCVYVSLCIFFSLAFVCFASHITRPTSWLSGRLYISERPIEMKWKNNKQTSTAHTQTTAFEKKTKTLYAVRFSIRSTLSSYLFSGYSESFNSFEWKTNFLKFIWKGCSFCSFQLRWKWKQYV